MTPRTTVTYGKGDKNGVFAQHREVNAEKNGAEEHFASQQNP
jgi:hypothetical protein